MDLELKNIVWQKSQMQSIFTIISTSTIVFVACILHIRYIIIPCCSAQSICYIRECEGEDLQICVLYTYEEIFITTIRDHKSREKVLLWLTSSFPTNSLEDKKTLLFSLETTSVFFCFSDVAFELIHLLIANKNATHTLPNRVWIRKKIYYRIFRHAYY